MSTPATSYSTLSCEELIALLTASPHFPNGNHDGGAPGPTEGDIQHSGQIEHHEVVVENSLPTNVAALSSAIDDNNNAEVAQGILPAQSAAARDAANNLEIDKNGMQSVVPPTIKITWRSNATPSSMMSVLVPPISTG
ncbi:hypothetical protein Q9L58_009407 [Maublancomyces gigas]|uniref:Uncharacterized protein n=1 Tax=Discina gigas TaxID=1032678 RepID=A0ABR3G703_9PEZI